MGRLMEHNSMSDKYIKNIKQIASPKDMTRIFRINNDNYINN